jgi:hypothetical protein
MDLLYDSDTEPDAPESPLSNEQTVVDIKKKGLTEVEKIIIQNIKLKHQAIKAQEVLRLVYKSLPGFILFVLGVVIAFFPADGEGEECSVFSFVA